RSVSVEEDTNRRRIATWSRGRDPRPPLTGLTGRSAQLAVLAGAPVVAAERLLFAVVRFLARYAQTHARHRAAARLGNQRLAFLAMSQARAFRHAAAGALDRVLDRRVDLILNGVVAGPTGGHLRTLRVRCLPSPSWGCAGSDTSDLPVHGACRGWNAFGFR